MLNSQTLEGGKTVHSQTRAFYLLFFVELWERFGYYGVQAILVLYATKVLGFTDTESFETFGSFNALMYITPLLGGFLADRFIGYQRGITVGLLFLFAGYCLLTFGNHQTIYLALGFIILGCGYFKACPASLVGKVYGTNDARIESAYTLFYMAVNIGAFVSMLAIGYISQYLGWSPAFGLCAAGLLIGNISFFIFRKWLGQTGSAADAKPFNKRLLGLLIVGSLVLLLVVTQLLSHLTITHIALAVTGVFLVVFYIVLIFKLPQQERNRLLAALILTLFAITFYSLYFQSAMSLNLFVDRNVQHSFLGFPLPTASFQSFNPFWIIVLAPILASIYNHLTRHKVNPSIPMKFAVGIIIMGTGFLLLTLSTHFANSQGIINSGWVFWSYFLQTLAEMLVSAIGLAMVAKLAPPKLLGMMMGTWYLAVAAAAILSGQLANLTSIPKGISDPLTSLPIYSHVFLMFGIGSITIGIIALLTVPFLNRLIGDAR